MQYRGYLYEPGPAFDSGSVSTLLYSFYGGVDAGDVGAMVADQVCHSLMRENVATINLDEVLDYRSRRPRIEVKKWQMTQMQVPECRIERVTDYQGNTFLVLHGVEPDLAWNKYARAIREICVHFEVKQAIDIMGISSNIPHTRPSFITQIAPEGVPVNQFSDLTGDLNMMGTFGEYLQFMLHEVGIKAKGLLVGVPFYLSDTQYPPASVLAIEHLRHELNFELPCGDLEAASETMRQQIAKHIENEPEIAQLVSSLEENYDSKFAKQHPSFIGRTYPDGENLATRLEQFLQVLDSRNSLSEDLKQKQPIEQQKNLPRIPHAPVLPHFITEPKTNEPKPRDPQAEADYWVERYCNPGGEKIKSPQTPETTDSAEATPEAGKAGEGAKGKRSARSRKDPYQIKRYPSRRNRNSS